MSYNPEIHHRRSIRLKNYDYSSNGLYFITLCCEHRQHLFGKIIDGKMILNIAGEMIYKAWSNLESVSITLHEFVIMPNHFHGIIEIQGQPQKGQPQGIAPTKTVGMPLVGIQEETVGIQEVVIQEIGGEDKPSPYDCKIVSIQEKFYNGRAQPVQIIPVKKTIGDIVGGFKSVTTNEYVKMVKQNILPVFEKRIWQRNYYEHIIRNEQSLIKITKYVQNNPLNWETDDLR